MRPRALSALLLAAAAALGVSGCAARTQPYRFSMPMLGHADVPAESIAAKPGRPAPGRPGPRTRAIRTRYAYGWQRDAQSGIRTVSAKGIELRQPEASAQAAEAVARDTAARKTAWSALPAPHRVATGGVTTAIDLPRLSALREPADLRRLVGTRDKRAPFAIAMGWLADLGVTFVEPGTTFDMATGAIQRPTDGPALVAWAGARGKLLSRTDTVSPGDILVFDRATSDATADLTAIVIGRDARGVTEFIYAANGVIRRGFVDATRPSTRRDLTGAIVNTFLRHTRKWPPKGTRYLAGELLAHVIRTR